MHDVILFIGPKAVGGSHWISRLIADYPGVFSRIRSTTTRPPRFNSPNEETEYRFLTRDDFLNRQKCGDFLETDEYRGNLYGLLRGDLEAAARSTYALMKITYRGALAVHEHLSQFPAWLLHILFLVPHSDNVLERNLLRREAVTGEKYDITDEITRAHTYVCKMRKAITPDEEILLSGTDRDYEPLKDYLKKAGIIL